MRGRRTTVIAGVAVAVLVLLAFLFLVSPKRAEVSQAQTALEEAQAQNGTLRSQLGSLKQAEVEAPANRKLIRRVEQQLPPTADPQGFILLLKNAADKAGVDLTQQTIGAPVAGANGVTTIPITVSLTGTYFSLDEYLFQLETLPRAAKVSAISMAPAGTEGATTSAGRLTMQVTMELYTTDISAGPGSDPGPTVGTVPAPTG